MKNIPIIVVNYMGCDLTKICFESIPERTEEINFKFIIVDNFSSEVEQNKIKKSFLNENVDIIFLEENYGYFRALNVGLIYAKNNIKNISFYIVGNNDLSFDQGAIQESLKIDQLEKNVVIISPNIINGGGRRQNPHSIFGISRTREFIYDIYYSNYFIAKLILSIANQKIINFKRSDYIKNEKSKFIKLGFGACYIIRPVFFNYFKALWAPMFLMGEELMFSRQLESRGIQIYYETDFKLKHLDNATISQVPSKIIWKYASLSHKIYRKFKSPYHLNMDAKFTESSIIECSGDFDLIKAQERLKNSVILNNAKN
jgi:GT2 family glycosyltransferase